MDFPFFAQAPRQSGRKGFIQRSRGGRIQGIHDQDNLFGVRRLDLNQLTHERRPVPFGSALLDLNVPAASERLTGQKQLANCLAMLFAVLFGYRSQFACQPIANVGEQLAADLIEAHVWKPCLLGPLLHAQHVFHRGEKGSIGPGCDTPLLFEPGLEFVFLSAVGTV